MAPKNSTGRVVSGEMVTNAAITGPHAHKGGREGATRSLVVPAAGNKAAPRADRPAILAARSDAISVDIRMEERARALQAAMTDTSAQWASPVLVAVIERLGDMPARAQDIQPDKVDKMADALVNTLVGCLAADSLEEDLGPFYSTTGLARRLDVTRQALDGRVGRHTLLALTGDDGTRLYPLFQFTEQNGRLEVIPGLADVMKRLAAADAGPMMTAAWLTAETPGLDHGQTAVEHLRAGGAVDQVLELAYAEISRWAS